MWVTTAYCFLSVIRAQDFTSITVGMILFLVNFVLLCKNFEPAQWYIILFYAGLYVLLMALGRGKNTYALLVHWPKSSVKIK